MCVSARSWIWHWNAVLLLCKDILGETELSRKFITSLNQMASIYPWDFQVTDLEWNACFFYCCCELSAPIVAGTCLSANHPALQRRRFDFCIVDEAGQVQQAATLGPLMAADKFVLVGDPLQLPPVVQSRTAKSVTILFHSYFFFFLNGTWEEIPPLSLIGKQKRCMANVLPCYWPLITGQLMGSFLSF